MAFIEINDRASKLLRVARLDRGQSIRDLARDAGLSEAVIRRIESPVTTRHREATVVRVARALGIRVSELLDARDGRSVGRRRGSRAQGWPVQVFLSYSHADEALMDRVRLQLAPYQRVGKISKWHDRQIPAGTGWREQVDDRVRESEVILLFLSPDFIDSKYCYEIEGGLALERHNANEALVIPVILRPCAWTITPFGELQAVPGDGVPVSSRPDKDAACLEAAKGIMEAIEGFV